MARACCIGTCSPGATCDELFRGTDSGARRMGSAARAGAGKNELLKQARTVRKKQLHD